MTLCFAGVTKRVGESNLSEHFFGCPCKHLCSQWRESTYEVCESTYEVCESTYEVCESTYEVCESTYEVCESTYEVCESTYEVCESTYEVTCMKYTRNVNCCFAAVDRSVVFCISLFESEY